MKKLFLYLGFGLAFNSAIGFVTSILEPSVPLGEHIAFAQCIGMTCIVIGLSLKHACRNRLNSVLVLLLSLPFSVAIGTSIAFRVTGYGSWSDPEALHTVVIALFFALIGSALYALHDRFEMEAQARRLLKSESERREIEVHLRLLQAQIEPHFLFNTLANVSSLIDGDPQLAKKLLERLNNWLRIALARARSHKATLGDELDMLENYLEIMKIRFGDRLSWHIEASDAIRGVTFPPMLLQPLVENALRHGIEPKLGGGEIAIRADIDASDLRIEIRDSGVGLSAPQNAGGAGLANIHARLAALFGPSGTLSLQGNDDGGMTATLRLPATSLSASAEA